MKKIITYMFSFWMVLMSQAQNDSCRSSLSGKVIDEHDHSALEYATVYIEEVKKATFTDVKGFYSFEHLCDGDYTIKISHLGCGAIAKSIRVKGKTIQNFYPEHHSEELKNVDIITQKKIDQSTQTKNDLSVEKLEQAKGFSLGEALKNITGVTTLNTGNSISKPIIHGMHSNRILILNNGVRQEGQQWGIEHAPELDSFIANQISVVKGANSVRYGSDAIAGVVLIDSKPLRDSVGINGELNLVGMTNGKAGTASAYLEGNFEKLKSLSWRIQGTLKQSGTVNAPRYMLANTGLKENNFSYALGWKNQNATAEIYYSQFNTTLGILSASHIGNLSDLQTAFTSSVPSETGDFSYQINRPYQHIEHELLKVKSVINTGTLGKLNLVYARQYNLRYEYDKYRPISASQAALNLPELQFEITSHTADLIWDHRRINQLNGSIGMSAISQANTYKGRMLVPNFKNNSTGIFWIERYKSHRIEIEGGLRYDYKVLQVFKYDYVNPSTYSLSKPVHSFENISANVGSIFKKDSSLNISFNLGTAWRAPSVNELYSNGLHQGSASLEYGDASLQLEKAYNSIFTLKYLPTKNLFVEVSPYYNYITNFIYRQPASEPQLTIRGAFPAFYYKQTNAILKGCDIYVSYQFNSSFQLIEKASILRAWNLKENNWLILMPSDRYETELMYRLKKHKTLTSSYLSASALFVTKQWRVPTNSDFVPPPTEYLLINLHASCTLKIAKQPIEFGLSVMNLFNQAYRDYLDRFRYFADAMGRNIAFRIKVPFNSPLKNNNDNKTK